jgi:hypothetical protein
MPIIGMIMLIMGIDIFGNKLSIFLGIRDPEQNQGRGRDRVREQKHGSGYERNLK